MSPERICPDCGAALPADALRGLCPQCLMGAALSGPGPAPGRIGATGVHEPAAAGVLATIALAILVIRKTKTKFAEENSS